MRTALLRTAPIEPPAVATPSATERLSGGVLRLVAPKIGPNPAAAMPMPYKTLPSVKTTPAVANAVMNMPATKETASGDRARRTEAVGEIADKRREGAHQQHCERIGETTTARARL
jgi:hypothetical protein